MLANDTVAFLFFVLIVSAPFWLLAMAALFCDRADNAEAEARRRHPSNG